MQYKYYEYMCITHIKYYIMYAYHISYFIDGVMDHVFICIMFFV